MEELTSLNTTAWSLDRFCQQRDGLRAGRGQVTAVPLWRRETPHPAAVRQRWPLVPVPGQPDSHRWTPVLFLAPGSVASTPVWKNLAVSRSLEHSTASSAFSLCPQAREDRAPWGRCKGAAGRTAQQRPSARRQGWAAGVEGAVRRHGDVWVPMAPVPGCQ